MYVTMPVQSLFLYKVVNLIWLMFSFQGDALQARFLQRTRLLRLRTMLGRRVLRRFMCVSLRHCYIFTSFQMFPIVEKGFLVRTYELI